MLQEIPARVDYRSPTTEELLRSAHSDLARTLARYRIPREDGEDLVQEACLALLTKGAGARDPRLWLIGALRVLCLRYRRALAYRLYDAIDAELLDAFADPGQSAIERRALCAEVEVALGRLRDRCREILRLRYGLGCDRFETGARLGCRPSSVGCLEKRCLAALGAALGGAVRGSAAPGRRAPRAAQSSRVAASEGADSARRNVSKAARRASISATAAANDGSASSARIAGSFLIQGASQ